MRFQSAPNGFHYVLTEYGYLTTKDIVKHERRIGLPIKGFETFVPTSWIENGYVVLDKVQP